MSLSFLLKTLFLKKQFKRTYCYRWKDFKIVVLMIACYREWSALYTVQYVYSVQRRQAVEETIAVIALWPSTWNIYKWFSVSHMINWRTVYILYRRLLLGSCENHWGASALLPDRPAWALWAWFPGANLSGAFYTLHLGSAFNTLRNIAFLHTVHKLFIKVALTSRTLSSLSQRLSKALWNGDCHFLSGFF